MRGAVIHIQRRAAAWLSSRVRRDDTGAISTETAIITALLGIGAVALAGFIADRIELWEGEIPSP